MARCYLIGIGGTGSKCVESFLHLCTAGLGPDWLWAMLVDQDDNNGNVIRTKKLFRLYRDCVRGLRSGGHELSGDCKLLHTELEIPGNDGLWCPLADRKPFRDAFNYETFPDGNELKDLMNSLYLKDERDLILDEGFRGRPSVGAAIMLDMYLSNDPFWKALSEAIRSVGQGHEVRIFIIGSVFGGMGASGVPVLARLIRREVGNQQNIHIGGALMLPYFSYPPSPEPDETVAHSEVFLEQTRGALKYYDQLFSREGVFDNLYLIGWDPLLQLSYFEKGGRAQENPSLPPELYAGLAAVRFFSDPIPPNPFFYIARNGDKLCWEDLPAFSGVRRSLGQLVRFAAVYYYLYAPVLTASERRIHESWFWRLLVKQGVKLSDDSTQAVLSNLQQYSERLLQWITDMVYARGVQVDLFDLSSIALKVDGAHHPATLKPKPPGLEDRDKKQLSKMVMGADPVSLPKVFEALTYGPPGGGQGLGVFCGSLYKSCQ